MTAGQRTLLFYLGGDLTELWRAIARARDQGDLRVVSLAARFSDESDLAGLPAGVPVASIADSVTNERVGNARALAWTWLEEVGYATVTRAGGTLADLVGGADGPSIWWLADITLQERTYLAVRLVESLDHFLEQDRPTAVAVIGSDTKHPWQAITISRWARARSLTSWPAHATADLTTPRKDRLIPSVTRPALDRPVSLTADTATLLDDVFDAALRAGELISLPIVAPLLAVGFLFQMFARRTIGSAETRVVTAFARAVDAVPAAVQLIVALAVGLVALIPVSVVLLVLAAVVIVRDRRAPRPRSLAKQVNGLARSFTPAIALWRIEPGQRAVARERRRQAILVVEDRGNPKRRVNMATGERATYNPYMEGVVDRLREAAPAPVIVALYGSARRRALARLMSRVWALLGLTHDLVVSDEITDAMWQTAALEKAHDLESAEAFVGESVVSGVFDYRGVSLADALRSELETIFSLLSGRKLYLKAFRSLLRRLQPVATVAYNWEGVFRPLTAACVAEGVPLIGVQQALGPYGHALDHRRVGYAQATGSSEGFPIPDRLCLWGEMHLENLRTYGYPHQSLSITGYPRLDAFVTADPSRRRLLKRLGIERRDAKIIVFAAVLRVLGLPLLRESSFVRLVDELVALAAKDPSLYIVVKPWPGDDLDRLWQILMARADRHFRMLPPENDIHNADLLAGSDVLITTFSSIVGEAVVTGCTPIVIDFPECRYYFGDEHVAHYQDLAVLTRTPEETIAATREALARSRGERRAERDTRAAALSRVFGPVDGRSAQRVAAEVAAVIDLAHDRRTGAAPSLPETRDLR